MTRPRR